MISTWGPNEKFLLKMTLKRIVEEIDLLQVFKEYRSRIKREM